MPAGAPAPEPPAEEVPVASGTVAEQMLSVLSARGVRHVFLNPGTDTAPFQEAASVLADRGLACPSFLPRAHESVALSAAHGCWQVTREPQCVMMHVDVGTQNLGAMLHDAMRDRAGVVLIAGKSPYDVDGRAPGGRDTYIHWLQDVPDPSAADVAMALNEVLRDHDVVVEEAVTNAGAMARFLDRRQPGTFFRAGGPGLGFGVGGSVGIKVAVGHTRQVVAVVGDGSFLFSVPVAGLMLAAQAEAPVVVVVLNNGCYRASQLPVFDLFPSGSSSRRGQVVGTAFRRPPDFALLARACHAHGEQVTGRGQLVEALQRGLKAAARGQAAVVDVVLAT